MFKKNKFKITIQHSDHRNTRSRTISVQADEKKQIYHLSWPGRADEIRVVIEREK